MGQFGAGAPARLKKPRIKNSHSVKVPLIPKYCGIVFLMRDRRAREAEFFKAFANYLKALTELWRYIYLELNVRDLSHAQILAGSDGFGVGQMGI